MARKYNNINVYGILFVVLLTFPTIKSENIDCYGKSFHCVNSTHFMICVGVGEGLSSTVDDFIIPCPTATECHRSNKYECEFPLSTTPTTIIHSSDVANDLEFENYGYPTKIPWEYFDTTMVLTPKYNERPYGYEQDLNSRKNSYTDSYSETPTIKPKYAEFNKVEPVTITPTASPTTPDTEHLSNYKSLDTYIVAPTPSSELVTDLPDHTHFEISSTKSKYEPETNTEIPPDAHSTSNNSINETRREIPQNKGDEAKSSIDNITVDFSSTSPNLNSLIDTTVVNNSNNIMDMDNSKNSLANTPQFELFESTPTIDISVVPTQPSEKYSKTPGDVKTTYPTNVNAEELYNATENGALNSPTIIEVTDYKDFSTSGLPQESVNYTEIGNGNYNVKHDNSMDGSNSKKTDAFDPALQINPLEDTTESVIITGSLIDSKPNLKAYDHTKNSFQIKNTVVDPNNGDLVNLNTSRADLTSTTPSPSITLDKIEEIAQTIIDTLNNDSINKQIENGTGLIQSQTRLDKPKSNIKNNTIGKSIETNYGSLGESKITTQESKPSSLETVTDIQTTRDITVLDVTTVPENKQTFKLNLVINELTTPDDIELLITKGLNSSSNNTVLVPDKPLEYFDKINNDITVSSNFSISNNPNFTLSSLDINDANLYDEIIGQYRSTRNLDSESTPAVTDSSNYKTLNEFKNVIDQFVKPSNTQDSFQTTKQQVTEVDSVIMFDPKPKPQINSYTTATKELSTEKADSSSPLQYTNQNIPSTKNTSENIALSKEYSPDKPYNNSGSNELKKINEKIYNDGMMNENSTKYPDTLDNAGILNLNKMLQSEVKSTTTSNILNNKENNSDSLSLMTTQPKIFSEKELNQPLIYEDLTFYAHNTSEDGIDKLIANLEDSLKNDSNRSLNKNNTKNHAISDNVKNNNYDSKNNHYVTKIQMTSEDISDNPNLSLTTTQQNTFTQSEITSNLSDPFPQSSTPTSPGPEPFTQRSTPTSSLSKPFIQNSNPTSVQTKAFSQILTHTSSQLNPFTPSSALSSSQLQTFPRSSTLTEPFTQSSIPSSSQSQPFTPSSTSIIPSTQSSTPAEPLIQSSSPTSYQSNVVSQYSSATGSSSDPFSQSSTPTEPFTQSSTPTGYHLDVFSQSLSPTDYNSDVVSEKSRPKSSRSNTFIDNLTPTEPFTQSSTPTGYHSDLFSQSLTPTNSLSDLHVQSSIPTEPFIQSSSPTSYQSDVVSQNSSATGSPSDPFSQSPTPTEPFTQSSTPTNSGVVYESSRPKSSRSNPLIKNLTPTEPFTQSSTPTGYHSDVVSQNSSPTGSRLDPFIQSSNPTGTRSDTFIQSSTPTEPFNQSSTLTSSHSDVFTQSSTPTELFTQSSTPTEQFTQSSTITGSNSNRFTQSSTEPFTQSSTPTGSHSDQFNQSSTPIEPFTQSSTLAGSHSDVFTQSSNEPFTQSSTPTEPFAQSSTPTEPYTQSSTLTGSHSDLFTQSSTEPFTQSSTPTESGSDPFTQSSTPTGSNSDLFTQSSTPSKTPTATFTPSSTATAPFTQSLTPTSYQFDPFTRSLSNAQSVMKTDRKLIYTDLKTNTSIKEGISASAGDEISENQDKDLKINTTHRPNVSLNVDFKCQRHIRGKFADKTDCRKYYICIGYEQPLQGYCPHNTVYSEINKSCTKNLSHCMKNYNFECPSEGRFLDYLTKNTYYICLRNINKQTYNKYKFQCLPGYQLNKKLVKCLSAPNVDYSSSNDSKSSKSNSEKESIEKKIANDTLNINFAPYQCTEEGKFPDPNDKNCRVYYECKSKKKGFRRKRRRCESDEYFDPDSEKCVDTDSYECEF